jgi:hypothetical protein
MVAQSVIIAVFDRDIAIYRIITVLCKVIMHVNYDSRDARGAGSPALPYSILHHEPRRMMMAKEERRD